MSKALSDYQAQHFLWSVNECVAHITLSRPEKKNPLTFDSYAELRDVMRRLPDASDVKVVIISSATLIPPRVKELAQAIIQKPFDIDDLNQIDEAIVPTSSFPTFQPAKDSLLLQ